MFLIVLQKVYSFLIGWPLFISVLGAGIVFFIGTGGFTFTHFGHTCKSTLGGLFTKDKSSRVSKSGKKDISSWEALTVAVGGTVGTGNVSGVATAVAIGGPGSIFWMWLAALLGMGVKTAEVSLAVYYRERDELGHPYGGPTYYISKGYMRNPHTAKIAKFLAILFGVLFMLNFLIGIQAYTITEAFVSAFDFPVIIFGVVYTICLFIVCMGGAKRVAMMAAKIVPFMTVFFILLVFGVLIANWRNIIPAFALIFENAFTGTAAVGGFAGSAVATAVRQGIARSVYSNEAGKGSSPMIHAQTEAEHPVKQGMWGSMEVFIDTIIVCTATALAIIASGAWTSGSQGATLSIEAFNSVYGALGGKFIAFTLLLFGFTTQFGWFTYYEVLVRHAAKDNVALKNRIVAIFRILFPLPGLATIIYAAHGGVTAGTVWSIADVLTALPCIVNLVCIVGLSGTYFKLVKDYKARYMGIGKIDPNFKVFYEDSENEWLKKLEAEKAAG